MFGCLYEDDFSFRVVGLIEDSISLICDVYSSVNLVVHNASHEADRPLRRVEAHDGNSRAWRAVKLMAGLCKAHRIVPVLAPGPAQFCVVAFHPKSGTVARTLYSIREHLAKCKWHLRTGTALSHLDR